MPISSIKSGFSQVGIITPFANNENCDISDDTEQCIDILDEENLQLLHSDIDDSYFERFNKNEKRPKVTHS